MTIKELIEKLSDYSENETIAITIDGDKVYAVDLVKDVELEDGTRVILLY